MSHENVTFERQINNFVNYGIYNYQFDEAGNLIVNSSSLVFQQHYLSLNLVNFVYDQNKILNFYDPTFQEFIKPVETSSVIVPTELQDYINNIAKENEDLRGQLNDVISSVDNAARTVSDEQEIRDIILQLRIALGQGKNEADFYTTFPYLPLTVSDQASGETTVEEMLPGAPQYIPPSPGIEFSHMTQLTGSGYKNVPDKSAVVVSSVTSSNNISLSSGSSLRKVISVVKIQPLFVGTSSGLKQYSVYDPERKEYVKVVKDLTTGLYVNRDTGTYYSLPAQYQ